MKNRRVKSGILLAFSLLLSISLFAQEEKKEESKMAIKVIKDGKTIIDTTYANLKDYNEEEINAIIEGLEGGNKMVKILKSGEGEDMFLYEFDAAEGKEGLKRQMKYNVVKKHSGDAKGNAEVIVIDRIGEDVHLNIEKDGDNVWVDNKDNVILKHKGGDNMVWSYKEGDVNFEVVEGHGKNDFMFFGKDKKGQISLDPKGDGVYRLAFESDVLEPIDIQVFDGEGNRLFKKKVKNFYGRFLKDVELEGNETGLFTVRVIQEEKEIIGEFEYK